MGRKIAIVLFNLGGPDSDKTVQPFLKNLFRDPAIITAPLPVRWFLARLISTTRAPSVIKNYAMMDAGGGSPLLPETEKQAQARTARQKIGIRKFCSKACRMAIEAQASLPPWGTFQPTAVWGVQVSNCSRC